MQRPQSAFDMLQQLDKRGSSKDGRLSRKSIKKELEQQKAVSQELRARQDDFAELAHFKKRPPKAGKVLDSAPIFFQTSAKARGAFEALIQTVDTKYPMELTMLEDNRLGFCISILLGTLLFFIPLAAFVFQLQLNNCTETNGCRVCSIVDTEVGECSALSQTNLQLNVGCMSYSMANDYNLIDRIIKQYPPYIPRFSQWNSQSLSQNIFRVPEGGGVNISEPCDDTPGWTTLQLHLMDEAADGAQMSIQSCSDLIDMTRQTMAQLQKNREQVGETVGVITFQSCYGIDMHLRTHYNISKDHALQLADAIRRECPRTCQLCSDQTPDVCRDDRSIQINGIPQDQGLYDFIGNTFDHIDSPFHFACALPSPFSAFSQSPKELCDFFSTMLKSRDCVDLKPFLSVACSWDDQTTNAFIGLYMDTCPETCYICPANRTSIYGVDTSAHMWDPLTAHIPEIVANLPPTPQHLWDEDGDFERSFRVHQKLWRCFEVNALNQLQDPNVMCTFVYFFRVYFGLTNQLWLQAQRGLYPFSCQAAFMQGDCFWSPNNFGENDDFWHEKCRQTFENSNCLEEMSNSNIASLTGQAIQMMYSLWSLVCLINTAHPLYSDVLGVEDMDGWHTFVAPAGNVICKDPLEIAEAQGYVSPEISTLNSLGLFAVHIPKVYFCTMGPLTVPRDFAEVLSEFQFGVPSLCSNPEALTAETMKNRGGLDKPAEHCLSSTIFTGAPTTFNSGLFKCCQNQPWSTRFAVAASLAGTALTGITAGVGVIFVLIQKVYDMMSRASLPPLSPDPYVTTWGK